MNLEQKLAEIIKDEATKLTQRFHAYHNAVHQEHKRNKKRSSVCAPKIIKQPNYWAIDKKFDPFYVRSKANSIAKSIARKIENGTYKPFKPYVQKVSKADGGMREVTIYQIPDAAVSKLFYARLLSKNKHRFSSFSYAYRNDRNVHFAIQDISIDLSQDARTFVAEFDFSDFFGSISHDFLKAQFSENGFFISDEERFVIEAFLHDRDRGIPQGTSISLFLANLVCWKLDKNFEKEGLKFARYADDTVIWSPDYNKICRSFALINEFSKETEVQINAKKSIGISLLSREGLPTEISAKSNIEFLGYAISVDKVSIKEKSKKKIQKQISYLLYKNLIQPLKSFPLKGIIIPANGEDEAFLTAIMQIRRYMYGGLTTKNLIDYINGRTRRIYFKGIMSFYPLITDRKQLQDLDGWLASIIHRTLKLRAKLLDSGGYSRCKTSFPFNECREELVKKCRYILINGKPLLEIPSFLLIHQALHKGLRDVGIDRVMNPLSLKYDY